MIRSAKTAVLRGCKGQCPACGEGKMLYRYIKVKDACDSCGTRLDGHTADDAPAWITITIVLHIVAPFAMAAAIDWDWSMLANWTVWPLVTLVLCLIVLPISKGGLIGYQWAKRLAGF